LTPVQSRLPKVDRRIARRFPIKNQKDLRGLITAIPSARHGELLSCQQAAQKASSTKEKEVAWVYFVCQVCQMKAVLVRDFLRQFAKRRNEALQVHQRGKVLGTWTPNQATPDPIDVLARAKRTCSRKLPFTGAAVLKAGKKR